MSRPRLVVPLLALVAALVSAGCGSVGKAAEGNTSRGKELFVNGTEGKQSCGSCHALADAGTQGRIGPNLDDAFGNLRSDKPGQGFDESTIRNVVRGQIAYPVEDPPTGAPGMPANLVTGEDAEAVAAYVASVAGLPVRGGGAAQAEAGGADGGAGGAGADGKAIFASAGCGGCHTFGDAGSSGDVGPNLDESRPSLELAIERVTNGKGAMPPFKDSLEEQQIRAVARYVSGTK